MKFAILIVLIFLFTACNTEVENQNNDTSSIDLSDTIIKYYDNNKIKFELPLVNGKRDGVCKWYFPSGKLRIIALYGKGLEVGETIYYFENGLVESYNFFDLKGNLRFNIIYDSLGFMKTKAGKSIYLVKEVFSNNTVSSKIAIKVFAATPPNSTTDLTFYDNVSGKKVEYKFLRQNSFPLFKTDRLIRDSCSFTVVSSIIDTITNVRILDTAKYIQSGKVSN